ncbi:unnamed protein product [Ceutorhynchus assimilis]|uniref:Uncharacterized protein n=1 Tax=Ceutorhynchus assimilis TaxID=467358 RepID=A0A9N9MCK1_9CUCU|nr:unnamed protein product [Ceutorhynchus assimilis]
MDGIKLDPLFYGWERDRDGYLAPTSVTKEIAPSDILKMVFCNRKEGTCNKTCSCRKLGLKCSAKMWSMLRNDLL